MTNPDAGELSTLQGLLSARGGSVLLGEDFKTAVIAAAYKTAVKAFGQHSWWTQTRYRPDKGLWAPQRKAVAFALAYLAAQSSIPKPKRGDRESALIKMPTGTGKSGVVAALACVAPNVKRTLVITPRRALVEQMLSDLSWRFWQRFDLAYVDAVLTPRTQIKTQLPDIESGKVSSIDRLRNDGYEKIWERRENDRQIIVGTFNALHRVLGLEPPPHRKMLGRTVLEPASAFEDEEDGEPPVDIKEFRKLLKKTDLLIVDEGHHEPAYAWAQCVDEINAPTLILTATPYRNDYKYFNLEGNFAFNLSFDEAVKNRLIREVVVQPLPKAAAPATAGRKALRGNRASAADSDDLSEFVASLLKRVSTYGPISTGRPQKCIVHAATYQRLRAIQLEIFNQGGEKALLIHDRHRGTARELNGDLRATSKKALEALGPLRFQYVHKASAPGGPGLRTKIWLHQYKLLEGIDNADFVDIFLYDKFSSARQLVQQAGRALRYIDRKRTNEEQAGLFAANRPHDPKVSNETVQAMMARQWESYLEYERYAADNPERAFTAETQLLRLLKKAAPDSQYIGGEFRKGFYTDENATMVDYVLPRRGTVCHFQPERVADQLGLDAAARAGGAKGRSRGKDAISTSALLDEITKRAIEALNVEDRFDIRAVPAPAGDKRFENVRLIRYLTFANSKLLHRKSLPEWRLGLLALIYAPPYLFMVDTEGLCLDVERLGLFSPGPDEMKRLFSETIKANAKPKVRIVEAAAMGLDLSETGVRGISIRKRSLGDGYFDLAEASQAPSSLHGIALLGDKTVRRNLSIRRGSLADPTAQNVLVSDYAQWATTVARAMANDATQPHPFFDRFALEVAAPLEKEGTALSLLLDMWELLDPANPAFEERNFSSEQARKILELDMCMTLEKREIDGKEKKGFVLADEYFVEVKYTRKATIPARGRYRLSCRALDEAIVNRRSTGEETTELDEFSRPRRFGASLINLINQEQAFRIIPATPRVVYANGIFFKPSINWGAIKNGRPGNLLDHLVVAKDLAPAVSEKGEGGGVTKATWRQKSQFGIIDRAFNTPHDDTISDPLSEALAHSDILVCDDGGSEVCDFFCLDKKRRVIALIHAKAKTKKPAKKGEDADADLVGIADEFSDESEDDDTQTGAPSGKKTLSAVSVSNLQIVGRQASASLAFVGSARAELEYPSHWKNPLTIRRTLSKAERDAGDEAPVIKALNRVQIKGEKPDPEIAFAAISEALRDPLYRREVWVVTSGLLSKQKAIDALSEDRPGRTALQFAYYLADLRTAFGRANVQLKMFAPN
jgi:hypothetical protein